MTNDSTMIGGGVVTTLLNPTVPTTLKLRNPPQSKQDVILLEDAVLVREEEKLTHDEEITSVESNDVDLDDFDEEPENDVEQTLIHVALAKSLENNGLPDMGSYEDGSKQRRLVLKRGRSSTHKSGGYLNHIQSTAIEGAVSRDPPPQSVLPAALVALHASGAATSRRNVRIKTESLATSRLLRSAPTAPGRQRLPSISEATVPNPLMNDLPSANDEVSVVIPSKILQDGSTNSFFPCPTLTISDEPASISVETPMPSNDCSRKVNFTADTSSMTSNQRMRGLSIDFDMGLEFPDDSSASVCGGTSDMHSVGGGGGSSRNRAYSFECFAFGINADEPLPPLEQSTSNAALVYSTTPITSGASQFVQQSDNSIGRPRGDSIIFDPVSFQDGGILEQHALSERSSSSIVPTEVITTLPPPPKPVPIATPFVPTPVPSSKASFPDGKDMLGESSNAAATSTTAALTLELLNKDGRIGIYLPEARRARIARFHAKRSKRVWRKRIKYDCRKKLADSRPRIKGRFVKRSDMDEDF